MGDSNLLRDGSERGCKSSACITAYAEGSGAQRRSLQPTATQHPLSNGTFGAASGTSNLPTIPSRRAGPTACNFANMNCPRPPPPAPAHGVSCLQASCCACILSKRGDGCHWKRALLNVPKHCFTFRLLCTRPVPTVHKHTYKHIHTHNAVTKGGWKGSIGVQGVRQK